MKCPRCDSKTSIKDTREKGDAIRRRHACPACGYRFSSIEITNEAYAKITASKRVVHAPSRRAVLAAIKELEGLLG